MMSKVYVGIVMVKGMLLSVVINVQERERLSVRIVRELDTNNVHGVMVQDMKDVHPVMEMVMTNVLAAMGAAEKDAAIVMDKVMILGEINVHGVGDVAIESVQVVTAREVYTVHFVSAPVMKIVIGVGGVGMLIVIIVMERGRLFVLNAMAPVM